MAAWISGTSIFIERERENHGEQKSKRETDFWAGSSQSPHSSNY